MLHAILVATAGAFYGAHMMPTTTRASVPVCQLGRREAIAGAAGALPLLFSMPAFASKADQEMVKAKMEAMEARSEVGAKRLTLGKAAPYSEQMAKYEAQIAAREANKPSNKKPSAAPAPAPAPPPAAEPAAAEPAA